MKTAGAPKKPFANYKWRWAVLTPTESLNQPSVFLGVLRAFAKHDGCAPSSKEVMDALAVVERETRSRVDLVRTQERNLVRNSGQYWKALGLLEEAHGRIAVSPFGRMLAAGEITKVEFATTIVKTLELPNRRIATDAADWDKASLCIRPLQLILDILALLAKKYDANEAYLTPPELVKIVIPLAGAKAPLAAHAEALVLHRAGKLHVDKWPDCATSANDRRMAREYLLFLAHYGFCSVKSIGTGNDNECYMLADISEEEITDLSKLKLVKGDIAKVAKQVRMTKIPANVERKKVKREVTIRPHQHAFRKNVLIASRSTCLITKVNIENVLEASHIIPVSEKGSDQTDNGLCLRSDIHELFDSGHMRLLPSGGIVLSSAAAEKRNYAGLPGRVAIPSFVNKSHLAWRVKYY